MTAWVPLTGLPWLVRSGAIIQAALEDAARNGGPCPTNAGLEDAGATSPWNVVGHMARAGNIVVEMYGRQRFITLLRGEFAGTRLGPPDVSVPTHPLYLRVDDKGRHVYRKKRKKHAVRVA